MPESRSASSTSKQAKHRPSKRASDSRAAPFKLRKLTLENYKAIDKIEILFPPPRMKDDPDVFVLGSKNGLGKTSILESCLLLFVGAGSKSNSDLILANHGMPDIFDLSDMLIRAGKESMSIEGAFEYGEKMSNIFMGLSRMKILEVHRDSVFSEMLEKAKVFAGREVKNTEEKLFLFLAGLISDPLIFPPLLYFHSYRKVQEGNPEIAMMAGESRGRRSFRDGLYRDAPMSAFKTEIIRSFMSRGGLFENIEDQEANGALATLNKIVEDFAGGTIEKLRPAHDNTVQLRVTPKSGGPSFSFDGLSSGQKEIISTLFLIWKYTRNQPSLVLIDEPELHLNVEWHQTFIRRLHELAPDNQYILATHSQEIFGSVEPDHRILLEHENGGIR